MNKKFSLILITILSIFILTACEKQVCSYCGEEKYCETYKVLDTERSICKECMNNPEVTASNNVINEYQAAPLDDSLFGVGSDRHNKNNNVSENQNTSNISENTSAENTDSTNSVSKTEDTANNQFSNNDTASQTSSYDSREDVVGRLAPLLSSSGLQLSPSPDNKKIYSIVGSDGNNTGITLTFDNNSNNKLSLNIARNSSADNAAYTNTCISAALAFINSTDYNQIGYDIYNNACQYGNYTKYGCRFYYMDNSDNSAEFDISYQ